MESNAYHGLACKMQQGQIPRHNEVNNLIQRALVEARIPARLEPSKTAKVLSGTLPAWIHYVKLM